MFFSHRLHQKEFYQKRNQRLKVVMQSMNVKENFVELRKFRTERKIFKDENKKYSNEKRKW